jgi:hypothetical protein
MHRLFNIIAETPPPQSEAVVRATAASFGDPTSIVLCTMGLCVGIIWLFWFDGFGALRKAPTRRCHQRFVFWPLAILICWIVVLSIFEAIIRTDAGSYPANAVLEIGLITGMLIIAQKSSQGCSSSPKNRSREDSRASASTVKRSSAMRRGQ